MPSFIKDGMFQMQSPYTQASAVQFFQTFKAQLKCHFPQEALSTPTPITEHIAPVLKHQETATSD